MKALLKEFALNWLDQNKYPVGKKNEVRKAVLDFAEKIAEMTKEEDYGKN